jgi:aminopeptidase N
MPSLSHLILGAGAALLICPVRAISTLLFVRQVEPVPSLLRGFSAPVKLVVEGQSDEHLKLMFAHDSDSFNRCVGV